MYRFGWLVVVMGVAAPQSPQFRQTVDDSSKIEAQERELRWTFRQSVERAIAFAPASAQAVWAVERDKALARQVQAQALPSLSATGTYLHLDHPRELAGRILMGDNQVSGNVLLQVPVVAPKTWGQISQSRKAVGLAHDRQREARRQAALDAAHAYLDALTAQHQLDELSHAVATQQKHLDFAQMRHDNGLGGMLDVLRAEQALSDSTVLWAQSKAARNRTAEVLGLLTGADGPVYPADDLTFEDVPAAEQAMRQLPWRRDDIRRAQSELELNRNIRHDSWLDNVPVLWAAASVLSTHPPTPTAPKIGWQVTLALSLPIYDGGTRQAQKRERWTNEQSALLALESALRRGRGELRQAFVGLQTAAEALGAAQKSRKNADQALELASEAYRIGTMGNLEVIDAERVSLDAATRLVEVHDGLKRAQIELLAAAGVFPPHELNSSDSSSK